MSAVESLVEQGFAYVPGLVPDALIEPLLSAFSDEVDPLTVPLPRQHNARVEPHERSSSGYMVNPVHNPHQLTIAPRFAAAASTLATFQGLAAVATEFFSAPPALLQTAFYDSSRGSAAHRDDHPFRADAPMLGAWVALEDIHDDAGPFLVFGGSHLLVDPELDRLGRDVWHARHVTHHPHAELAAAYRARLHERLADQGPTLATIRRGDVVFWDRRTVHGSRPPVDGTPHRRRSLNVHYIRVTDLPSQSREPS